MKHPLMKPLMSLLLAGAFFLPGLSVQAALPDETTTITLEEPIHFVATDGSNVVAEPGMYSIDIAQEWLRLTPSTGRRDALLVEATKDTHDVEVEVPIAMVIPGDNPQELNLLNVSYLKPDGTSLEALGTTDGIRPRGFGGWMSKAKKRARAAAARARKAAARRAAQARAAALRAKRAAEQAAKEAAQKAKEAALKAKRFAERQAKIAMCKTTVSALKAGKAAATFMKKLVPTAKGKAKNMLAKLKNDSAFRDQIAKKIADGVNANKHAIPEISRIQAWMNKSANKRKLDGIFGTNNFCEDSIKTMDAKLKKLGIAPNFALIRSRGGETPHFYMGYQLTLDAGLGLGMVGGLYGVTDFKGNGGKYWFLGAQGGVIAGGGGSLQVTFFPKVDLASFDGGGWGVGGSLGTVATVNADVIFDEKFKKFQGFGIGGGAGVGPAKMFGDIAVSWDYSWKY